MKLFAHVMGAQNCQNWCEPSKAHPVCAPVPLELPVQLCWAVFWTVSLFLTVSVFLAGLADKCHVLSCSSLPRGMWCPWLRWSQCCFSSGFLSFKCDVLKRNCHLHPSVAFPSKGSLQHVHLNSMVGQRAGSCPGSYMSP